jgi:NAD(P)-dependent dehydrogenase (short-subunit alcohol dehydrogenase family)
MKTIVVTGASDGIGAAARKLHADGHRVIVVGRSPEKTAAVAKELGADHFVADFAVLDKLIAGGASVIQTSSFAARMTGKIEMDDLEHDRDFNANVAYGTVKLENILFTKESTAATTEKGRRSDGSGWPRADLGSAPRICSPPE